MANISFFVPTNMVTVGATNPAGTVTQETSTKITFTDGFNTAEYFGSFTYVGNDFFGTWTSFREFAGAVLTIDAGNFSVDAHVAEPYIKDNLLPKLFPLLLTGNDVITGSTGTDGLLEGYDGNDLIAGGGGNDYIDGGTGTNTALYTGNHTDYSFIARSEINIVLKGVQVTDLRVGSPNGTDQDVNIQFFQFDDGIFSFTSGQLIPQSQTTTAGLAVAVEATMYNATGTAAEINLLTNNFLPPQITNATVHGLNAQVYACEALGLVFAFGNETGSTAFSNNFGPSNSTMPNTTTGDAAFATAASNTIFGSASTTNLINVMEGFISNWKAFFTANGVPGLSNPSAAQIDLAARGASWGDMVGVALVNNLGPLSGQVTNFLNDVALGTAVYGASLTSQPTHATLQGEVAAATATSDMATPVNLMGIASGIEDVHLV